MLLLSKHWDENRLRHLWNSYQQVVVSPRKTI